MKKRLYFGHPINVYGTSLEDALLARIAAAFPDWEVENPNQKKHDEGYERYKRETGRPMDYYVLEVLPSCHGGVFLPFRDGAWGAGVFKEAQAIAAQGGTVWTITADGQVTATDLAEVRVLTVDETRARVRDGRGKPLPF